MKWRVRNGSAYNIKCGKNERFAAHTEIVERLRKKIEAGHALAVD